MILTESTWDRRLRRLSATLTILVCFLPAVSAMAKTVTLRPIDNQTTICLVEGDSLVVMLPSPTPAAYKWTQPPLKSSILARVGEFAPPSISNPAATQIFRYNAALQGKVTLKLNFEGQGVGSAPNMDQTFSVEVTVAAGEPASMVLLGDYKGMLPCADCTGLQTELRLYARGPHDFTNTTYISTRTYLGGRAGDQSFTDRGGWAVLKGDAVDANATVYELDPDRPEQAQYYLLQQGGAALTQLDRQKKPIEAPGSMNFTLKKVE